MRNEGGRETRREERGKKMHKGEESCRGRNTNMRKEEGREWEGTILEEKWKGRERRGRLKAKDRTSGNG